MICNDRGRCFETRGRVYRDYDEDYVAPRRSHEYRGPYRDYDEGPGVELRFEGLRQPLLNQPVMPPRNHFVEEVWPRGHSAGSAIQIAGRKGVT